MKQFNRQKQEEIIMGVIIIFVIGLLTFSEIVCNMA